MKEDINPEAIYDLLFIADRLKDINGAFSSSEIHLFAYLACLLSLYGDQAVADWGYVFVGTEQATPFSPDIDAALRLLKERGNLLLTRSGLEITPYAHKILETFSRLDMNRERERYLLGACSVAISLSSGMIGYALSKEPEIKRSNACPANRYLLEEAGLSQLYGHFAALRRGLGTSCSDLRILALSWLVALYKCGEIADAAS